MKHVLRYLGCLPCLALCSGLGLTQPAADIIGAGLYGEASAAYESSAASIAKPGTMIVIDFARPSAERRFYVVDMRTGEAEALLVAHGQGSDPDHDGMADRFSNTPDSRMTSLGRFVTGRQYVGRHGVSLRLHGLDPINDLAEARAIVIHGADYVDPARSKMGRSWGCPALEPDVAERLIPEISDGVFVYAAGPRSG